MVIEQTIFVPALGSWTFPREHSWQNQYGGWHSANSWLFTCPGCTKQWAFLQVSHDKEMWPIAVYCQDCAIPRQHFLLGPPGSLLHPIGARIIDEALLEALPPELLQREAVIHFRWAEIEAQDE